MQNIITLDTASHNKRQALPSVFINECQNLDRPAVMGSIHHKII